MPKVSLQNAVEEEDLTAEIEELRRTLRRTQQQLAKAKGKNADLVDAVLTSARESYLSLGKPAPILKPKSATKKGAKGEVALLHLTDWQNGKRTISYDMSVMDARVRRCMEKTLAITDIVRASRPVDSIHILLGGDMVENTMIFPGQAWEVEATTFEQVFAAANTAEAVVRAALENFSTVSVTAEFGNHGRMGHKNDGTPRGDNWDRILYKIVEDRFTNEKRLTWSSSDHWHQRFEIGNYKAILVHGDEFRGFGGNIPMYGILKKVNSWKSGVLPEFLDCYMGHYHNHNDLTLSGGGSVFMTGSTESDNEYAREFVAASATPSQRLHFVDPVEGRVTAQYRLDLA